MGLEFSALCTTSYNSLYLQEERIVQRISIYPDTCKRFNVIKGIFIMMLCFWKLLDGENSTYGLYHPSVHSLMCPLVAWQVLRPLGGPVAARIVAGNGTGGAMLGHLEN